MSKIMEAVDVRVPVRTAYDQWTQFETFPAFMEGVKSVRQLDATTLEWVADVAGSEKRWKAKITEQEPDRRIAWTSTEGAHNAGVVTFHRLSDDTTRIMLQMEYDPEGLLENAGDFVGVTTSRIIGDLERFKEFIEHRGQATGAWRGSVARPGSGERP